MTAPPAAPRRRRDEQELEPDPRQDWFAVGIWFGTMAAITWPRTRGAATLGLSVLLTRVIGARAKRLEDTIAYLFRQRESVIERVEDLEDLSHGQGRLNAEVELRIAGLPTGAEIDELRDLISRVRELVADVELITYALAEGHVRLHDSPGGRIKFDSLKRDELDPRVVEALDRICVRLPF